jgi:hypothetical protein
VPIPVTGGSQSYSSNIVTTPEGELVIGELKIRIADHNGEPLANMAVTLHSVPQTVTTDSQGIATFTNVSLGSHTVTYLTTNNESVSQPLALTLIKDASGMPLRVTVDLKAITPTPTIVPRTSRYWWVGGGLGLILACLAVLLWLRVKRSRHLI